MSVLKIPFSEPIVEYLVSVDCVGFPNCVGFVYATYHMRQYNLGTIKKTRPSLCGVYNGVLYGLNVLWQLNNIWNNNCFIQRLNGSFQFARYSVGKQFAAIQRYK